MSQQKQQISFSTKTDKLEVITHIVSNLLKESGGEVMHQHARTQTLEKLQSLNGDSELQNFDSDDFDALVENTDPFTQQLGQFDQKTISHVNTVGHRPDWLGVPDTEKNNSAAGITGFDADRLHEPSRGNDDFSQLNSVTDHQPDALKEAGFETFRDLYEADKDNLTDVPGVTNTVADDIQDEASEHIDPVTEIAQEAYKAEMEGHTNDENDGTSEVADTHLVTDVKIPAGKPRNPNEYSGTNEPWHIHGLPILEKPTLTLDLLTEFVDGNNDLTGLLQSLKPLIEYDTQFNEFKTTLTDTVDDIDELETALEHPRDLETLEDLTAQVATDVETLETTFETFQGEPVNQSELQEFVNTIDLELEDEIPVKARLNLVAGIKRELEATPDVSTLLDDTTLNDLVQVSEAPIELNHPFIESLDDYPELKTRTLETGETDLEAAARIVAKNNYALDLLGHAGVGKDTLLKVLAAVTNRPVIVINMDESMISQDLMGIHKIDEDGKVIFKDGVIPHAAKYGYWLIISEVNAAAPEILTAFHQLLEADSKLHIKERDEVFSPSAKFRLSTTRNPPTAEYDGAKELNGAFKRRLNSLKLDYLDHNDEVDLIDSMTNTDRTIIEREDIDRLVSVANDFRQNAEESRQYPRISTSKLLHIIDLYDGPADLLGATKESIKAHLGPTHREEGCMNAIEDHF